MTFLPEYGAVFHWAVASLLSWIDNDSIYVRFGGMRITTNWRKSICNRTVQLLQSDRKHTF